MSRGNLALALFLLVALLYMPMGMSDGDTGVQDIHSMTVFLDSSESGNYDYMVWDFGDGTTADSRAGPEYLNPVHTYAEKGTYTIRQTVHNGFEDKSEDSLERTVNILGPPTVTLMDGDRVFSTVEVPDRTSVGYNPAPIPAEVPSKDGWEFIAWTDSEGAPYDWTLPVRHPLTLHAEWTESAEPELGTVTSGSVLIPSAVGIAILAGVVSLMFVLRRS